MPESTASLYFEDLHPGRRFDLGDVKVARATVESFAQLTGDDHPLHLDAAYARAAGFADQLAHGSLVAALVIGRFIESAIMNESLIAMSDLRWNFLAPIYVDQRVAITMEITDRRLKSDVTRGSVGRRFEVRDGGQLLQEGASHLLVRTRDATAAQRDEEHAPSFGSVAWTTRLAERLRDDEDFGAATSSFDGTMALAFGDTVSAVRIYRGRVIDAGRALATNATFTIVASYETWLAFARRPRNEFISFAMGDAFRVRGSTYDYLRLTRAVMIATDHVRALLAASPKDSERA